MPINYEIVRNPDNRRWHDILKMVCENEGWCNGLEDYRCWKEGFGDNLNFLVAVDKDTDRTLGSAATATYEFSDGSPSITCVGMYAVQPDLRGQGVGLEIFKKLTDERFKNGENMSLVAALAMFEKYKKIGFDKFYDWHVKTITIDIENVDYSKLNVDHTVQICDFDVCMLKEIIEFDMDFTGGLKREAYLTACLGQSGSYTKIALVNDEIKGICHVREGYGKQLIAGPFYATNKNIASTLLFNIFYDNRDLKAYKNIRFFIPSNNQDARDLLDQVSGKKYKEGLKEIPQFTKKVIEIPTSKIYGFTECTLSYI